MGPYGTPKRKEKEAKTNHWKGGEPGKTFWPELQQLFAGIPLTG